MIVYPKDWEKIGHVIETKEIEDKILSVIHKIDCDCLALSGGLDSSLMLYFMLKVHKQVRAFTIGLSEDHPDIKYSVLVAEKLGRTKHIYYIPTQKEINEEKDQSRDFRGDKATRLFYKFVSKYTQKIISCDGLDEYMCGYYAHRVVNEIEHTYYDYIWRLQHEQLNPLDKNSMGVNVYLPYLDSELLFLFTQIPLVEKVDREERKKVMCQIAKNKIPDEIITRRKYGFCDVLEIKK